MTNTDASKAPKGPVAGVDIGTNSVKMLIRDGARRHFETAEVRLGQGVDASGVLHPDAVARTLDALRTFRRSIDEHGVALTGAVATSAVRDSASRDTFLQSVAEVLGVAPVVLSGESEGRLGYLGAMCDLPDGVADQRLVLDIGGGSTEFVVGQQSPVGAVSIDVGCVRLTESELRHDPPRPEELSNAIGRVQDHLDDVLRDLPSASEAGSIIGIGGTITAVAAVEIGTWERDPLHGFWLSREAVEDVFRTLATESLADRLHNPGLTAGRAPVIVGGLCVLVAVLRRLKADGLVVSTRSVVDGICTALTAGVPPTALGAAR
jgi:exopolyphosphatase/guanosine-5'-triphosphate,3'-diphosphate pyrophosphatase